MNTSSCIHLLYMQEDYIYPKGGSYVGERESRGKRHGHGILKTSEDNSYYIGEFHEGVPSGYGVQVLNNEHKYSGQFVEGMFHGNGVLTKLDDNFRVEGRFKQGKLNGFGRVYFPDGTSGIPFYEGIFKGHRLVRQEKCPEQLEASRLAAEQAFTLEREILAEMSSRQKIPAEEETSYSAENADPNMSAIAKELKANDFKVVMQQQDNSDDSL